MNIFKTIIAKQLLSKLGFDGIWRGVHKDKDGNVVDVFDWHNLVTDEGYHHILDAVCHHGTQIDTWYFEPFIDDYTPIAGNTYASPGYTAATDTHYSESGRQEWPEDAPSGTSITNSTAVTITAATTVTFYGCGLVGGGTAATTKADTAGGGILLSSGKFPAGKSLTNGETLDINYTLQKA